MSWKCLKCGTVITGPLTDETGCKCDIYEQEWIRLEAEALVAALQKDLEEYRERCDVAEESIVATAECGMVHLRRAEKAEALNAELTKERDAFKAACDMKLDELQLSNTLNAELLDALRVYADAKNWNCPRCGKQDDVNCFMGRWIGPIGEGEDVQAWNIARASIARAELSFKVQ